jgi:hypothetical protein
MNSPTTRYIGFLVLAAIILATGFGALRTTVMLAGGM